jgi:hypothetical protein
MIFWLACTLAHADIVQSSWTGSRSTDFYRPLGQSFTATNSEAQVRIISFLNGTITNSREVDPTIELIVRNGIGYTGSVVGSQTVSSIPASTPSITWINFEFASPITLIPGQAYTLEFSATNEGLAALSYAFTHNNPYSGGTLIERNGAVNTQDDLAFRVIAVPESSTAFLACAGLLCLAGRMRLNVRA